jgi:hypothetical protein
VSGATEQERDYRGRYLPVLRWTPDGSREWLIWSKYWNAWHRRSEDGGACGYTSDIAQAGLFPRSKAASYNDDRNRPYHVSEKVAAIQAAILKHDEAVHNLSDFLASADAPNPAVSTPSSDQVQA